MLEILGWTIVGLVVLFVVDRATGLNLVHLVRTQVGKFGRSLLGIDSASQMEQACYDTFDELKNADKALVAMDRSIGSLNEQIEKEEIQLNRGKARLKQLLDSGSSKEHPDVKRLAPRLVEIEKEIVTNRAQLKEQVEAYNATLERLNSAARKTKDALNDAEGFKSKIALAKAAQNARKILDGYSPQNLNGQMGKIGKYAAAAKDELATLQSQEKVSQDRNPKDILDDLDNDTPTSADVDDLIARVQDKK